MADRNPAHRSNCFRRGPHLEKISAAYPTSHRQSPTNQKNVSVRFSLHFVLFCFRQDACSHFFLLFSAQTTRNENVGKSETVHTNHGSHKGIQHTSDVLFFPGTQRIERGGHIRRRSWGKGTRRKQKQRLIRRRVTRGGYEIRDALEMAELDLHPCRPLSTRNTQDADTGERGLPPHHKLPHEPTPSKLNDTPA